MSEFTPGPWFDVGPDENVWICTDDIGEHRVAFMASNGPRANARLIAAAPELYEALRRIASREFIYADDCVDCARAALSKVSQETGTGKETE